MKDDYGIVLSYPLSCHPSSTALFTSESLLAEHYLEVWLLQAYCFVIPVIVLLPKNVCFRSIYFLFAVK